MQLTPAAEPGLSRPMPYWAAHDCMSTTIDSHSLALQRSYRTDDEQANHSEPFGCSVRYRCSAAVSLAVYEAA
jgi:hypothetical protein